MGTSPGELRALADWLVEREVEEVVMESTAQYGRPVWEALELHWRPKRRTRARASANSWTLHLAQAQSNRGAGGHKKDFPDAERLVTRLVAQELTLSFVPDAEQRLWRTVMRHKYQIPLALSALLNGALRAGLVPHVAFVALAVLMAAPVTGQTWQSASMNYASR